MCNASKTTHYVSEYVSKNISVFVSKNKISERPRKGIHGIIKLVTPAAPAPFLQRE